MYTSRGIGRPNYDRKSSDRSGRMTDRSPYENSPDINYRSDDRHFDRKSNNVYNERKDNYRSPHESYQPQSGSYTPPGPPPPQTPTQIAHNPYEAVPYTPSQSSSKPLPNEYNQNLNYKSNPPSDYRPKPPSDYRPNPSSDYRPNPPSDYRPSPPPDYRSTPSSDYRPTPPSDYKSNPPSEYRPNPPSDHRPNQSYGRDYGGNDIADGNDYEDQPMSQKEIEEKLFQQKLTVLFQGVNSIDEFITLKEAYNDKAACLDGILQKSCLKEGDILRNKRRNRDDFKDPALLENKRLQEDVKRKLEEVNRFKVEIDRKIRAYNKAIREALEADKLAKANDNSDKPSNYEAQLLQNAMITSSADDDDLEEEEDEYEYENQTKEYFDSGSHWCRDCDKMVPKMGDLFEHLHTKEHWKLANNELKPWKKPPKKNTSAPTDPHHRPQPKTKTPIKGVQFLIPLRGFYCPLCKEHLGDNSMAEEHLKSAKHNRIYNRFICLNVDYEHKWNTDKGKALARHQTNERKRIKEEEEKENEKKKTKEELKAKEEKEAKKKKREEENKRKEREEKEREREEKKNKSNTNTNSSDRFRLKNVTLDLNNRNESKSSKDRGREKERDKHKKRTRIYSSDSSSSSSSPPRKKKQTYFGDPYKDPKLKRKSFVDLFRLNRKTAQKYKCKELIKLIEENKNKKDKPKTEVRPNSPIKMDIDIHNDDENERKDISSTVDGILKGLEDEENEPLIKTIDEQKPNKDNVEDSEKDNNKEEQISETVLADKESEKSIENKDNKVDVDPEDSIKENGVREDSIDSENKLQIDMKIPETEKKDETEVTNEEVIEKIVPDNDDEEDENGFEPISHSID